MDKIRGILIFIMCHVFSILLGLSGHLFLIYLCYAQLISINKILKSIVFKVCEQGYMNKSPLPPPPNYQSSGAPACDRSTFIRFFTVLDIIPFLNQLFSIFQNFQIIILGEVGDPSVKGHASIAVDDISFQNKTCDRLPQGIFIYSFYSCANFLSDNN